MIDYDKHSDNYAGSRKVSPALIEVLMNFLPGSKSARILEVGCGTGNYVSFISNLDKYDVYGIDVSEKMIEQAKQIDKKTKYCIANAEKIPFENNFFDLVYSVDVIHHIPQRLNHFSEVYRTLKANSYFLIMTDSKEQIKNRPSSKYFPRTVEVDEKRYPETKEIVSELKSLGFTDIKLSYTIHEYDDHQRYLKIVEGKSFSSLLLISESEFKEGLKNLRKDISNGTFRWIERYTVISGFKP